MFWPVVFVHPHISTGSSFEYKSLRVCRQMQGGCRKLGQDRAAVVQSSFTPALAQGGAGWAGAVELCQERLVKGRWGRKAER